MAFFSIALTLNLTGVRLNQLKLSDLSPSALAASISHQYYTTWGHLNRYYSNLRIVYELESRVNEMRRDTTAPAQRPTTVQQPRQSQPKTTGKPGGSARKSIDGPAPEPVERRYETPTPVLALYRPRNATQPEAPPRLWPQAQSNSFSLGLVVLLQRPGNHYKPSERSLA